jgi:hypothetical protein
MSSHGESVARMYLCFGSGFRVSVFVNFPHESVDRQALGPEELKKIEAELKL